MWCDQSSIELRSVLGSNMQSAEAKQGIELVELTIVAIDVK